MMRTFKISVISLALAIILSVSAFATPADALLSLGDMTVAPSLAFFECTSEIFAKLMKENKPEAEKIDRGHIAYVVSAQQKINLENEKYYATLTLINETGLFTVDTVDDVENYNFMPVLRDGRIGKMTELEGKFVQFDMRDLDKIYKLETRRSDVSESFTSKDGFYLVNIVDERNGVVTFYDTASDVTVGDPTKSASYHDDGCEVISIGDDKYAGSFLRKISSRTDVLPAGIGNAVIVMSEGEIIRIFSFEDGYSI